MKQMLNIENEICVLDNFIKKCNNMVMNNTYMINLILNNVKKTKI